MSTLLLVFLMIIHYKSAMHDYTNVCLSINKLCNDTLHFVFLFCIYYFQVVFHEIQFRHTFELNYGHINVNF